MSKKTHHIPDKALKLLPWYVTGRLSPQEREYMQKTLAQNLELRNLLDAEYKVLDALKEDSSILDQSCLESTDARLGRLLERLPEKQQELDGSKKSRQPLTIRTNIIAYLSKLLSGSSAKTQYIAFAALSTLALALIFSFVSPLLEVHDEQHNTFYPASSATLKTDANQVTTLLVGLNTEPDDPQLLSLLKENKATIKAASGKSGMHYLKLSVKLSPDQTKTLLKKLTDNKELFWFAGENY